MIELLVALAIIGLIAALALSAAGQARESARRVSCANNLKQIGLAVEGYLAACSIFPPCVGTPNTDPTVARILSLKQFSIFTHLLPYFDQTPVFNSINFDVGAQDPYFGSIGPTPGIEANQTVMRMTLAVLICPSDGLVSSANTGSANYRANMGTDRWLVSVDGPFMTRGVQNTPAAVRDGLSYTASFSEKLIGSGGGPTQPRREMYFGNVGLPGSADDIYWRWAREANSSGGTYYSGGFSWFIGTLSHTSYNHIIVPNDLVPDCLSSSANPPSGLVGPRSNHPGGVNLGLCDGSVRFIKNNISRTTWKALGSCAGGEILSGDQY